MRMMVMKMMMMMIFHLWLLLFLISSSPLLQLLLGIEDAALMSILLSDKTGKPLDKVAKDSERDYYMSAEEAQAYGLIDRVVSKPITT